MQISLLIKIFVGWSIYKNLISNISSPALYSVYTRAHLFSWRMPTNNLNHSAQNYFVGFRKRVLINT